MLSKVISVVEYSVCYTVERLYTCLLQIIFSPKNAISVRSYITFNTLIDGFGCY